MMKVDSFVQKAKESVDGWNSVEDKLPEETRELYIVVQKVGEEDVRTAAFFEQDGNGQWGFNKPDVSHWMKWPEMPKAK